MNARLSRSWLASIRLAKSTLTTPANGNGSVGSAAASVAAASAGSGSTGIGTSTPGMAANWGAAAGREDGRVMAAIASAAAAGRWHAVHDSANRNGWAYR